VRGGRWLLVEARCEDGKRIFQASSAASCGCYRQQRQRVPP
jgi:hypothetical protein